MNPLNMETVPRGMHFVRCAIATAVTGSFDEATYFAANLWRNDRTNVVLRGAIAALNGSGDGAELAAFVNEGVAFAAVVREASVLGKIGTRRVPPTTRLMVQQVNGASASWVAEGAAIPLTTMNFDETNIAPLKVVAMLVQTIELMRAAGVEGEAIIRADLIAAVAEAADQAFLDPANAGVAGEKPAAATYGATAIGVGVDLDDAVAEAVAMLDGDPARAVAIMRPELAVRLAKGHQGLTVRGGEAFGLPTYTTKGLPLDSAGSHQIVVIDPVRTLTVWDQPEIRIARHASLEFSDTPAAESAPSPTGANAISLWQTNAVGFLCIQRLNWLTAEGSAVIVDGISGAGAS